MIMRWLGLFESTRKASVACWVKTPYGEGFFDKAELCIGLDCQSVPDKRSGP
jgi:hypothetical protein